MKPLEGIRVLDLTNVLAGPFCCYQLALLGAEVIKVEVPGAGDLARQLGADPELNARLMGASFLAQNAGKRSVTLNLKDERGRASLLRLVATADVLVENFRPGVMERLGLGCDDCPRRGPGARLLRASPASARRAAARQPGLRPDHPGPVRHDERHRRRGDRAAARRLPGLPTRSAASPPPSRSAAALVRQRAHRRGRVHRRLDAGGALVSAWAGRSPTT